MRKLIPDGQVAADDWQLVEDEAADLETLPEGKVIVPLPLWLEQKSALQERLPELGVWLNGHDEPDPLLEDLDTLPLVAVNFPVFTDGRGFSLGRLLRERYGFQGELRATGYFLRDQLCYLRRCGFNVFDLPDKFDPAEAVASLHDFSEYYQGAVDQPLPLFRRRDTA